MIPVATGRSARPTTISPRCRSTSSSAANAASGSRSWSPPAPRGRVPRLRCGRRRAPALVLRADPADDRRPEAADGGRARHQPRRRQAALQGEPRASGRSASRAIVSRAPSRAPRALVEVYREASGCTRCPLAETRTKVVFGAGDADADLMFVGEAPGADEDRQGLPFVGRAGGLLDELLGEIGLDREYVFIANVLNAALPATAIRSRSRSSPAGRTCSSQVELIQPRVIVDARQLRDEAADRQPDRDHEGPRASRRSTRSASAPSSSSRSCTRRRRCGRRSCGRR